MWIALFITFLVLLIYGIYHDHTNTTDVDIEETESIIPFDRLKAHERAIEFLERNRCKNNYSKHI